MDIARKLKLSLFEILDAVDSGKLPAENQEYGGVLVKVGDDYKQAYLRLSFEEPPIKQ